MNIDADQQYGVPEGIVKPEVDLVGIDGNAFSVMGTMSKALKRAGNPPEVIDAYTSEAMAGDYDHLLLVTMAFNGDLD